LDSSVMLTRPHFEAAFARSGRELSYLAPGPRAPDGSASRIREDVLGQVARKHLSSWARAQLNAHCPGATLQAAVPWMAAASAQLDDYVKQLSALVDNFGRARPRTRDLWPPLHGESPCRK